MILDKTIYNHQIFTIEGHKETYLKIAVAQDTREKVAIEK